MKLDGNPVDAIIIAAWKLALSKVSATAFIDFVAQISYLNVWFRGKKISVSAALTRLCAELGRRNTLGYTCNQTVEHVDFPPVLCNFPFFETTLIL
jgi:hypothetical protein